MSAIVWIASYPKSGNTWMRALLAQYTLDRRITSRTELERHAPDLTNLTNAGLLPAPDSNEPLFVKTHFLPGVPLLNELAGATSHAIYLVRDPRDVIRSAARHLDIDESKYVDFAEQFIACEGVPDWIEAGWGTWPQSVAAWTSEDRFASAFPAARLLVLRYEDLCDDPSSALRRIASFVGLEVDADRVDRAVRDSTLERLRQAERAAETSGLRAYQAPSRRPFIGTGRRGQSLAELGEHIETAYKDLLARDGDFAGLVRQFGYGH